MVAADHQRKIPRVQNGFDFLRQFRVERRHRVQGRVACTTRHPQDRLPCDVLQWRVVKGAIPA